LSGYDLRERFSRLLTFPPGRRYSSAMDRRVNSAPGAGIQLTRKKQILIFHRRHPLAATGCRPARDDDQGRLPPGGLYLRYPEGHSESLMGFHAASTAAPPALHSIGVRGLRSAFPGTLFSLILACKILFYL
jgi:hypothetical protein